MFYTVTRLLPPVLCVLLWAWLGDGTAMDPANLLLPIALLLFVLGVAAVRRYWHIRNTSRSRRDSTLLT